MSSETPGRLLLTTTMFILVSILIAVWIVGIDKILDTLTNPQPMWLTLLFGAQLLAYGGYTIAYRGLYELSLKEAARRTLYGFSPLAMLGGFAYDIVNTPDSMSRYKVAALSIMEYVVLAPLVLAAALYALVTNVDIPLDFSLPWAIGVPLGALIAWTIIFWRKKIKMHIRRIIDKLLGELTGLGFKRWAVVLTGMSIYWGFELATMYAALRLFGGHISLVALIIAFGTGYVLTRRSLPASLGGLMIILMILVLHWLSVPFGAAFWATYCYLLVSLLLPLGYLAAIRHHLIFRKLFAK